MEFYSHAKEKDGKIIASKKLKAHLNGVYQKAINALYEPIDLDINNEAFANVLRDIAFLHDLGKYTSYFQDYLLQNKHINKDLRNHSRIGAFAILNKYADYPLAATFLYFIISMHHRGLSDISRLDIRCGDFGEKVKMNFDNQRNTLLPYFAQLEKETELNNIKELVHLPITQGFRKALKNKIKKTPSIKNYFTINYLFSLLVEADKIDASETLQYKRKPMFEYAVERLIGKAEFTGIQDLNSIKDNEQNKLRNYVRAAVLANLDDNNILDKYLFTLTAPTGIGKTLTSLDFALRLKTLIRKKENYEPQIIYGLPFINIIEQGLKVYSEEVFKEEVLDNKINILAHYQYSDLFGKTAGTDKQGYHQQLMSLNTWQCDIVITSFVQFFETLISNRNKMLLKFNHLAGSIIILDEVQTLRLKQLPLLGSMLYFLSRFLKTRIILMTATKPKIFELANKEILSEEREKATPCELLKVNEKVFEKFNRTKIVPLIQSPIATVDAFFNLFKEKWNKKKSCLIVCNTVQRSIDVFNKLQENGITELFYLSTNIVPAERMKIIQKVKNKLKDKSFPVLVSTQVVEAGVDLDFDMGFRDLAPIDSIVQVAGRINRENDQQRKGAPLYIIEFEREYENRPNRSECELVYDKITRNQVYKALQEKVEIQEREYFGLIDDYFSITADKRTFHESREFFNSIKKLCYDGDNSSFPVSKFKIINEPEWAISVFIELNEEACGARIAYDKLLSKEMGKEEFDKNYKQAFNQYIIAAPVKYTDGMENINEFSEAIKLVRMEYLGEFYDSNTGLLRKGDITDKAIML